MIQVGCILSGKLYSTQLQTANTHIGYGENGVPWRGVTQQPNAAFHVVPNREIPFILQNSRISSKPILPSQQKADQSVTPVERNCNSSKKKNEAIPKVTGSAGYSSVRIKDFPKEFAKREDRKITALKAEPE